MPSMDRLGRGTSLRMPINASNAAVKMDDIVFLLLMLSVSAVYTHMTLLVTVRSGATVELSANVTFSDPKGKCPLATESPVEFLCEVTDTVSLTWRTNSTVIRTLSSSHSPSDHLIATGRTGFKVQLIFVTLSGNINGRANLTSRLVVDPSALRFGDQISCGTNAEIASLNYTQRAPPPPVNFTTDITKETGNSVGLTLRWNSSFTETHAVDEYCVIAHGGVCHSGTTCFSPEMEYVCSGLEIGSLYGFTVYSENCGNQMGAIMSLLIAPQVPSSPSVCVAVPEYDTLMGILTTVKITWKVSLNPSELVQGINQDVFSYNISFQRDGISRGSKNVLATDVCRAGRCVYDLSTSFFGSYYTLSVAAENIVGLGEYLTCTPWEISTTNNMIQVVVNSSVPEHATVECQSLPVAAMCEVCYGTSPNCHNLTCLEPVYSSDDGQATLALPTLERRLRYCYEANVLVDDDKLLVVQGTFSTDCEDMDLVYHKRVNTEEIIVDLRCPPDSVGSLPIPNGVMCYTGTVLDSRAYYICDDDYLIPGHSDCSDKCNQRECQVDGHWSGETLPCLEKGLLTSSSSNVDGAIFAGFVILFGAGILATVVFTISLKYIMKRRKQSAPGISDENRLPEYEDIPDPISDNRADMAPAETNQGPIIDLNRNIAYGDVSLQK